MTQTPSDDMNYCHDSASVNELSDSGKRSKYRVTVSFDNNMQLDSAFQDAIIALGMWNNPPRIFQSGGELVYVDERDGCRIAPVSKAYLKEMLAEAADWLTEYSKSPPIHVYPPDAVVAAVRDASREWRGIPVLKGVTQVPIPRADGTFRSMPGYDPETKYYLAPGVAVPDVGNPTQEDAAAAADYLMTELFCDFPFKDAASRANMLAATVSVIMRPVAGRSPLFVITKPQPGEGSGLLVDIVSNLYSGDNAPVQDANITNNNEEMGKVLVSLLRAGTALTNFDNLSQDLVFNSPVLAGFLTSDTYRGRCLGKSEMLDLPNSLVTFVTGRNVKIGGDLPRRSVLIEMRDMDVELLRDASKRQFRHPRIINWIRVHRGELIAKVFTMYRAWVLAGRPLDGVPSIGKFERWCDAVGGMLLHAGVRDFLGNRAVVWDSYDEEGNEWGAFLAAWHDNLFESEYTARELLEEFRGCIYVREVLPDALYDVVIKNQSPKGLGNRLASMRDVPAGGYVMRARKDPSSKIMKYRVEPHS